MSNQDLPLLALMPSDEPEVREVLNLTQGKMFHVCRLQRDPINIDEFDQYRNVALSMNNGTFTLINTFLSEDEDAPEDLLTRMQSENRYVYLVFNNRKSSTPDLAIFGPSNDAIIETAIFFVSLKCSKVCQASHLSISCHDDISCKMSSLVQHALAFQMNPPRRVAITWDGALTEEVTAIIATQPHPIDLDLGWCSFEDGGDAFIGHLQSRKDSFGSLAFGGDTLNDDNLKRFFNHLALFEKIDFPVLPNELLLRALSAPMKFIHCNISDNNAAVDLSSVDISVQGLYVYLSCRNHAFLLAIMRSLFHGLAHHAARLEHFQIFLSFESRLPVEVAQKFFDALKASQKLRSLDLSWFSEGFYGCFIMNLLANLEEHASLETLKVRAYPTDLDPDFSWLKKLLKRNRKINVVDIHDKVCTDGDKIDALYAFNRFFRESDILKREEPSVRSALFVETLSQYAANDLQRSVLLLAHHVDLLCDGFLGEVEEAE